MIRLWRRSQFCQLPLKFLDLSSCVTIFALLHMQLRFQFIDLHNDLRIFTNSNETCQESKISWRLYQQHWSFFWSNKIFGSFNNIMSVLGHRRDELLLVENILPACFIIRMWNARLPLINIKLTLHGITVLGKFLMTVGGKMPNRFYITV